MTMYETPMYEAAYKRAKLSFCESDRFANLRELGIKNKLPATVATKNANKMA